jgi:hypothetical protein
VTRATVLSGFPWGQGPACKEAVTWLASTQAVGWGLPSCCPVSPHGSCPHPSEVWEDRMGPETLPPLCWAHGLPQLALGRTTPGIHRGGACRLPDFRWPDLGRWCPLPGFSLPLAMVCAAVTHSAWRRAPSCMSLNINHVTVCTGRESQTAWPSQPLPSAWPWTPFIK